MKRDTSLVSRRGFLKTTVALPVVLAVGPSLVGQAVAGEHAASEVPLRSNPQLDRLNVAWDSPGGDSLGSMPIGNGDIGANVWVENNGDLLFYISKVDSFDSDHLLPKLGRVRLSFTPPLDVVNFRQQFILSHATVTIRAGSVDLKVWVDANSPVIRVTGTSSSAVQVVANFETLRPCAEQDDRRDRLAWGYRNTTSEWRKKVQAQNSPEFAAKVEDPILNRTSGCRMSGPGFLRHGKSSLKRTAAVTVDLSVRVLSTQTATLQGWFAALEEPVSSDWVAHTKWWQSFWRRSHIFVTGCGQGSVSLDQCRFTQYQQGSLAYEGHKHIPADTNAFQLTQRYALERFCEVAAGRGVVPPPYNGSIFTMDMPAGVKGFDLVKTTPISADGRDWASLSFMWQNTRHPYWSMPTRGDYDTMLQGMKFVREGLEICRDRCRNLFHHDGAYIMEASWWNNVGFFNPDEVPRHLLYHFLATLETLAMMCEYYEHTYDTQFLAQTLLPCADEFLKFYELHYPQRDKAGKMVLAPAGTVETYQDVTNPNTEVTALRFVLTKLLSFKIGAERRAPWTKFLAEVPHLPTRTIKGLELLAVGEQYEPGRQLCESPELYSVYPFRQAWIGQPALLAMARQSFHLRTTSLDGTVDEQAVETGGWQAAPVQAAYLGLAREAARLASINFNDQFINWHDNLDPHAPWPQRPRARFPGFWECKMDGTPDNDHGANSANVLESMLLQSDGSKIYLLPAWPEDWDVEFKLCANQNTTVECVYSAGKVRSLKVNPASRQSDIVDFSTVDHRIRTLVSVALADRNYLFDLPPMLDAQPISGNTTVRWLADYGHTLADAKAGPWSSSVFKGNTVFVHVLDWPGDGLRLASIPRKLLSARAITGKIDVQAGPDGIFLTGEPDPLDTIVQLEFDGPIDPVARAQVSHRSLTLGRPVQLSHRAPNGHLIAEVSLGSDKTFDRFEFTIANPGHLRGEGKAFEIQTKLADSGWTTCYEGKVFGSICGKRILPIKAQSVRLVVDAPEITQLDVFEV